MASPKLMGKHGRYQSGIRRIVADYAGLFLFCIVLFGFLASTRRSGVPSTPISMGNANPKSDSGDVDALVEKLLAQLQEAGDLQGLADVEPEELASFFNDVIHGGSSKRSRDTAQPNNNFHIPAAKQHVVPDPNKEVPFEQLGETLRKDPAPQDDLSSSDDSDRDSSSTPPAVEANKVPYTKTVLPEKDKDENVENVINILPPAPSVKKAPVLSEGDNTLEPQAAEPSKKMKRRDQLKRQKAIEAGDEEEEEDSLWWADDLKEAVTKTMIDNTVIVVFSNEKYKDILVNWLASMNVHKIPNIMVISLDRDIHEFLEDKKVPNVLVHKNYKEHGLCKRCLWRKRVRIFQLLNEWGIDFISSDVDAFWYKNPLPWVSQIPNADMLASRGTFPKPISKKWGGGAICCGFFYMRSAPATQEFLRIIYENPEIGIEKTGDDQLSFNYVLDSMNPHWQHNEELPDPDWGMYGVTEHANLKVVIFPNHIIVRHCGRLNTEQQKKAMVLHCKRAKSDGSKKDALMMHHSWWLKNNWEDVQAQRDHFAWLDAITNTTMTASLDPQGAFD